MQKFIARLAAVLLAAGLIVGAGFAAQHWQPVASFFSKGGASEAAGTGDHAAGAGAGDESTHPAEDKGSFEQWPDLGETGQLVYATQVMLPVLVVVVAFDVIRRRSRSAKRLGSSGRVGMTT